MIVSCPPAISPTGVLTFTPAPNVSGSATVSLQLHDNGGTANGGIDTSAAQTFTITVFTNTAPVAHDDTASTNQNTGVVIPVLANDTDVNGDVLHISAVVPIGNGSVIPDVTATTITYTPFTDFAGVDTFQYVVTDGHGGTSLATVTVTVLGG